jgi:hypothetical protein
MAWGYFTLWKRTGDVQPGSKPLAVAAGIGIQK